MTALTDLVSTDNLPETLIKINGNNAEIDSRYNNQQIINTKDHNITGNGVTDDYTAFMTLYNSVAIGSTIELNGFVRITTPMILNKQISIVSPSLIDAFLVDLTDPTQNAITFYKSGGSIDNTKLHFNIYGAAATAGTSGNYAVCNDVVVFKNCHRNNIKIYSQCGADGYAMRLRGSILNRIHHDHSASWVAPTPVNKRFWAADHLYMEAFNSINSNANEIYVAYEGRRHGITVIASEAEGNYISGVIENHTGKAFNLTNVLNWTIEDLWIESSTALASTFTGCKSFTFKNVNGWSPGVSMLTGDMMNLVSCKNFNFVSFRGSINIDSNCIGTQLGDITVGAYHTITDNSTSTNMYGGITYDNSSTYLNDSIGLPSMENIFPNPYMDLWSLGASGIPDYFSNSTDCTFTKSTTTVYQGNPELKSAYVQSTATALARGCRADLPLKHRGPLINRMLAATVAVYIPTGQPDLIVYVVGGGGSSYYAMGGSTVTVKDTWVVLKGAFPSDSNGDYYLKFVNHNGSNFVAGNYYVGGISVCLGHKPPKFLCDHGKRREYYATSISYTPSFIGQEALVAGVWYKAIAVASSADWKALN